MVRERLGAMCEVGAFRAGLGNFFWQRLVFCLSVHLCSKQAGDVDQQQLGRATKLPSEGGVLPRVRDIFVAVMWHWTRTFADGVVVTPCLIEIYMQVLDVALLASQLPAAICVTEHGWPSDSSQGLAVEIV